MHTPTATDAGGGRNASYDGTTNANGEPHGEGRRTFTSGHVYHGQWKDGRCDGFGRFTYPDGQVFEGQWQAGRRNGEGILSMPNGETISGTWSDDTLSGAVRRWNTADEAASAVPAARNTAQQPYGQHAGGGGGGGPPVPAPGSGPASPDADAAWLRESHDVIWQLNVELQMENERVVAENRRLRLKLRQLLQNGGPNGHAHAHGEGGTYNPATGQYTPNGAEPPKVVEGKLRRKKKGEKADKIGASDTNWIAKLLDDAGVAASGTADINSLLLGGGGDPGRPRGSERAEADETSAYNASGRLAVDSAHD